MYKESKKSVGYCFQRRGDVYRTPTMWIAKGGGTLNKILPSTWASKVVKHKGDTIKCMVLAEKVVVRYNIAKQQLSVCFSLETNDQQMGSFRF